MGADEPGDDRRLLRPDPSATERRAYRRLSETHVRERKSVSPLGISRGIAGQHCARPGALSRMAPSFPTPSAAHAAISHPSLLAPHGARIIFVSASVGAKAR